MTETDLRWKLRQLPREMDPPRDLWPAIEAAIARPARVAPTRRHWLAGVALAASVLLAGGLFWKVQDTGRGPEISSQLTTLVVGAEAQAISLEYQSALRQFDGAPVAGEMREGLDELDRSVEQIQRAIAANPDSVFLLQQLKKTYSRRLALTQRAVIS